MFNWGLSSECNSVLNEYNNLELSGSDKGANQLTKKAIFAGQAIFVSYYYYS